jgi:hypothetical protein
MLQQRIDRHLADAIQRTDIDLPDTERHALARHLMQILPGKHPLGYAA